MDISPIRVPEYVGKACAKRIPHTCAVEKLEYIKDRKRTIEKMDVEINALKKIINETADTESRSYKDASKRLKKCYEIRKNCEDSIVLVKSQIEIEKKSRVR